MWLSFLPFEDKGHNAELDNFLQYDTGPTGSARRRGSPARSSPTAVNDGRRARAARTASPGPTLLDRDPRHHDFDDNGFISPTDVGGQSASKCLIGMQVQNGKFVRVDPVEPGTFDCTRQRRSP